MVKALDSKRPIREADIDTQKLVRLRVLLQFVAIIVIMATVWIMGR
jgi:hypothetical protein